MKHFVTSLFPIAATLLMAAVNSSCIFDGEEECPENLEVTIDNDWMEAPDAAPGGILQSTASSKG